jgi:20S proteasome alpha/beta subunit
MTMCLAATCMLGDNPMVVAASDRMITFGDIEFEPPQAKVYELSNSIVMLIAGDAAIMTEIARRASGRVNTIIEANIGWVFVEVAANIVGRVIADHRRDVTERLYLEPFGLTHARFLERQATFAPAWVQKVNDQVLGYVPEIQCIVTGLDTSGAHIYTVDGRGELTCHDAAGFAAIGSGSRHAQSVMMFAGHTKHNAFGDAVFLTYSAKRESEVSPGGGAATDMFIIPQLGGYSQLAQEALAPLLSLYDEMKATQRDARNRATEGMNQLINQQVVPQEQEGDDTPVPPEEGQGLALPPAGNSAPPQPPPTPAVVPAEPTAPPPPPAPGED